MSETATLLSPSCTHCTKTLESPRKSAQIPNHAGEHYIICSNCGNVMRATYQNKILTAVKATPQDHTPSTIAMIIEAQKLFADVGNHNARVHFTKEGKGYTIVDLKTQLQAQQEARQADPEAEPLKWPAKVKRFFSKLLRRTP